MFLLLLSSFSLWTDHYTYGIMKVSQLYNFSQQVHEIGGISTLVQVGNGTVRPAFADLDPVLNSKFGQNYISNSSRLGSRILIKSRIILDDKSFLLYVEDSITNTMSYAYNRHIMYILFTKWLYYTQMTNILDISNFLNRLVIYF